MAGRHNAPGREPTDLEAFLIAFILLCAVAGLVITGVLVL